MHWSPVFDARRGPTYLRSDPNVGDARARTAPYVCVWRFARGSRVRHRRRSGTMRRCPRIAWCLGADDVGDPGKPQSIDGGDTAPNIVLFPSDDMGWGQLGFNGGEEVETPSIDIAKEGVQLTQFYVAPVCTATRGALLTGRQARACASSRSPARRRLRILAGRQVAPRAMAAQTSAAPARVRPPLRALRGGNRLLLAPSGP